MERMVGAAILVITVFYWLFRSPKMRCYYALIAGKAVPEDLADRVDQLMEKRLLSPAARERVHAMLDSVETLIILGFIVAVVVAFWSTV